MASKKQDRSELLEVVSAAADAINGNDTQIVAQLVPNAHHRAIRKLTREGLEQLATDLNWLAEALEQSEGEGLSEELGTGGSAKIVGAKPKTAKAKTTTKGKASKAAKGAAEDDGEADSAAEAASGKAVVPAP